MILACFVLFAIGIAAVAWITLRPRGERVGDLDLQTPLSTLQLDVPAPSTLNFRLGVTVGTSGPQTSSRATRDAIYKKLGESEITLSDAGPNGTALSTNCTAFDGKSTLRSLRAQQRRRVRIRRSLPCGRSCSVATPSCPSVKSGVGVTVASLEDIQVAATRGVELVRQILAFSRKQPANRAVVSLTPMLEETARMLRVALPVGVELTVRLSDDAPTVLANVMDLQRVIMNLGINARDALEGRPGRITIALDNVAFDATSAPPRPELRLGRFARIVVSDTASGMDAATLERVFEPFFTTKAVGKGSGLGLAVVHGVVEAHGGTIIVDSRLEEGTSFSIYLPAAEAASSADALDTAERAAQRVAGLGRHVLFLDDEPGLVASGVRLLELRGYRTTGFTRPSEALEAIRSDPTLFDVVVTDLSMPELSGLDVAREILRLRPELPVVALSGHFDEGVRAVLLEAGVRRLLDKPCSAAELDEVLRGLTEASSAEG